MRQKMIEEFHCRFGRPGTKNIDFVFQKRKCLALELLSNRFSSGNGLCGIEGLKVMPEFRIGFNREKYAIAFINIQQ